MSSDCSHVHSRSWADPDAGGTKAAGSGAVQPFGHCLQCSRAAVIFTSRVSLTKILAKKRDTESIFPKPWRVSVVRRVPAGPALPQVRF